MDPQHGLQTAVPDTNDTVNKQLIRTTLTDWTDRSEHSSVKMNTPISAQTARAVAVCIECRKSRVMYSKLSERQKVLLAVGLSEFEFSCGSSLFPPSVPGSLKQSMSLKPNLQCVMPVEISYYGSDLGRRDLCAYCGIDSLILISKSNS